MSQLIWAVCNRPVGFGVPLAAGTVVWAAYRSVYCPPWRRAAGRMLLGTTQAEHHETTGGIALFRAGRRRRGAPAGWWNVLGLFLGACRCLVEDETDRQVSQKLKTLE